MQVGLGNGVAGHHFDVGGEEGADFGEGRLRNDYVSSGLIEVISQTIAPDRRAGVVPSKAVLESDLLIDLEGIFGVYAEGEGVRTAVTQRIGSGAGAGRAEEKVRVGVAGQGAVEGKGAIV